jgi:hypothetical protein
MTFRRWTSVVIGSLRRSSALPPSAITIRILGLLARCQGGMDSGWGGQRRVRRGDGNADPRERRLLAPRPPSLRGSGTRVDTLPRVIP